VHVGSDGGALGNDRWRGSEMMLIGVPAIYIIEGNKSK